MLNINDSLTITNIYNIVDNGGSIKLSKEGQTLIMFNIREDDEVIEWDQTTVFDGVSHTSIDHLNGGCLIDQLNLFAKCGFVMEL